MIKSKNKILVTILLAIVIITKILPVVVLSANIGDSIGLTSVGTVPYHLKSHAVSSGGYVITDLAGYYENGNFYPAYCLDITKPGIGDVADYDVTLTEILSDQENYNRVWRTIVAGYPYNSPESLGVSDWRYAYQATKIAVYCVLGQSDVNSLYATDSTGQQIVDLIHRLVNEGKNGTSTYRTPVANIKKSGNMILSGDYYIQNYMVSSNVDISGFNVAITNFPEGTILTNTNGVGQNFFKSEETFQVKIPKNIVETQEINGRIRVDVNSKSYAVFYAKNYNPSLQEYAVTGDPISLTSATTELTSKANTASIKIHKIDKDTKQPIKDTIYELTKEDGTVIGRGTTDSKGNLTFYELYQGNYILKEVKSNDDYIISQESIDIRASYNKVTEITLENEHKKGNLKLYKVDKDNNKIALGNVEFDLYSEEFQKVIGTYTTDVNGEIYVANLRIGDYKWIEKRTNKWYNLAGNTEIKVEWDKTKESVIENELKKGQIRVIKTDLDNNEIRLKGVKFNVLDENNNVLETIITNDEGEAITSKYAVRDFESLTLQEVETLENYELTEEPKAIELKTNEIVDVTFQNEKKKGKIEITKISANANKLTGETKGTKLDGAVFEIYNEKDELVDTIIIRDGIGTSKLLEYGDYYIKEVNSGSDNYLLNTGKYDVEIREHMKTIPIIIENTSVDIGLDIDKNGIEQAQPNDEIKYSFNSLKNTSNVSLDNFTWTDNLPYEYVRITKLFTGTYNEDLDYVVKYKTNKSNDYIEYGKYNTQKNNYIDFTIPELAEDEYIIDFKVEFGTVMAGFEAVEKPFIFAKVLPTVKPDDRWTNYTNLTGNYKRHELEDKAEWTTISYGKKLEIKKLPKTGF